MTKYITTNITPNDSSSKISVPNIENYPKKNNKVLVYGTLAISLFAGNYTYSSNSDYNQEYKNVVNNVNKILNDTIVRKGITALTLSKEELKKQILSFVSLSANWDGHGAVPPLVECACNSLTLIDNIEDKLMGMIDDFYPNPNGTISMIWENSAHLQLSLEVGKSTMSYFVEQSKNKPIFVNNKELNAANIAELKSYISYIIS